MARSRTIPHAKDSAEFQRLVQQSFDEPTGVVTVEAAAEAANVRRITLQVRDRIGAPWPGRWLVTFFLSATQDGDPDATGNTVGVATGTIISAIIADAMYQVLTDATGKAEVDVEVTGAGTRWVHAMTDRGRMDAKGPFVWA